MLLKRLYSTGPWFRTWHGALITLAVAFPESPVKHLGLMRRGVELKKRLSLGSTTLVRQRRAQAGQMFTACPVSIYNKLIWKMSVQYQVLGLELTTSWKSVFSRNHYTSVSVCISFLACFCLLVFLHPYLYGGPAVLRPVLSGGSERWCV